MPKHGHNALATYRFCWCRILGFKARPVDEFLFCVISKVCAALAPSGRRLFIGRNHYIAMLDLVRTAQARPSSVAVYEPLFAMRNADVMWIVGEGDAEAYRQAGARSAVLPGLV